MLEYNSLSLSLLFSSRAATQQKSLHYYSLLFTIFLDGSFNTLVFSTQQFDHTEEEQVPSPQTLWCAPASSPTWHSLTNLWNWWISGVVFQKWTSK